MSLAKKMVKGTGSGALTARLVLTIASVIAVPVTFAQHIQDGQLVFPERRITAFAYHGASEEVMRATARRITTREGGTAGSWVYEWQSIAELHESIGDEYAENHRATEAREAYLKANVYYALAWFPGASTPEERLAYEKQLNVYQKAGVFFEVALEVVDVPFRGSNLITYLHRPPGVERPPLVVWSGGSDQYKANHYRPIQELLKKGLAVVTFDLPGFGESQEWPSEPSADDAHIAIMEHFIARGDIDAERIGFVGVSWGGYFATRVAARNDPRVRAVGAGCAPVHELFSAPVEVFQDALASPERMTLINLARHLQIEATAEAIHASLQSFSLVEAGLVGKGRTITTPLLVFNGTRDGGVPVADLRLAHESAVESDLWLLGRGEHCAVEYWPIVIPQLADWLIEKMAD